MSTFTDFLADHSVERVVLIELVSADNGTKYIGSETFVTGAGDTPANTIYEDILAGEIEIERRLSGPLNLRGGTANISDIIIANPDGSRDDWIFWTWQSATIWFGSAAWSIATIKANGKRGEWKIDRVEANDLEIRFELNDRYDDIRVPVQSTVEVSGEFWGQLRPYCAGYPKNVTPQLKDNDSTPIWIVHEAGEVEDVAVTRYINQKASTSPAITKYNSGGGANPPSIDMNSDPQGLFTVDVKGVVDGSWLTTPGEILTHALTRMHDVLSGFLAGGSSTTAVLDQSDNVSDSDDEYNAENIIIGVADDPAQDNGGSATVTDYDGGTRTITVASWAGTLSSADAGDTFEMILSSDDVQAGALTTADLDTDAFDALDTLLPYEMGVWLNGRETNVDLLDSMLAPAGFHYWKPVGTLSVGVLEDPSTNFADTDFDNWTANNVTVNSGQADPDGGANAFELQGDATGLSHRLNYDTTDASNGERWRCEIKVKNVDTEVMSFGLSGVTGGGSATSLGAVSIRFGSSGAYVSSVAGGTPVDIRFTDSGDGFTRIAFTVTMNADPTLRFVIRPVLSGSAGESIIAFEPKLYKAPALLMDDSMIPEGPDGIEIIDVQHPVWRMRVGYDKNHTVASTGVAGTIPPARGAYITREYRYQFKEDYSILNSDPNARDVEIPTLMTTGSDARTERDRMWSLFSVQRATYAAQGFTEPMGVELGQVIEVTDSRHGFEAGKRLVLLGMVENLTAGRTELELWG